ncbi:ribonuclease domain-containing protein [Nocardioides sp. CER19]|uniref:ribonuclease domain-containing protein n=1 Tax=Nocardioides sp. CER19 TaxID=3038538 RepID=UPI00244A2C74|nr:ribonuclease domain-containing protein [Nocardioides sp. CER19]MDH2416723.1 ribonuclease domain-containing protein [Nocardioides sp. CER19]
MTRRTLAPITAIAAVLAAVLLALSACGNGDDPPRAAAPTSSPSTSSASTSSAPTPSATRSARVDPESGLPWVGVADLPPQARQTLELIDAGGPFPYPGKDGSTFGNLEGLLPKEPRGYYAEYTVPTPGSRDRGARRIITGEGGEYYWTADHYQQFERIRR